MSLLKKPLMSAVIIATVGLSGCSTIGGLFGSDENYRTQEGLMVSDLEVPPNLFNPAKASNATAMAMLDAERRALAAKRSAEKGNIPTFKSDGLSVQSNLSERWLEITEDDSQMVWKQLQRFFVSQGFRVEEARKDIGIMKTAFLARQQIVPTDDQGPITKLLNSWRDQYAEGIYDKFTARLESDPQTGKIKVFFAHHEMFAGDRNAEYTVEGYSLKPSNPVMEAEALYQAMVFFGSSPEHALQQLAATQKTMEVFEGEEFVGLTVNAGFEETWNYLQSAVFRAGWDLGKINQATGLIEVKVPETARNEETLLGALAFWREKDKTEIPETVLINVKSVDQAQTSLMVKAPQDESGLTAEQKKYIFESLGLLTK